MPVQRNGKQNCYRPEEKRNVITADFICVVADSRDRQKANDENRCDENWVEKRISPLGADSNADFVSNDGKDNSEHDKVLEDRVIFPLRFYPRFLIFCTAIALSSP